MIAVEGQLLYIAAGLIPPRYNPFGLRDYQLAIQDEVEELVAAGYRRILVQLPTGGGKTRLSAGLIGDDGQFIVHRKELIDQTSDAFAELGIDHGFVASGRPSDPAPVTIAGIQTLVNRLGAAPARVIQDEAHRSVGATYEKVHKHYRDSIIIGLTATPQRLDGRGLGDSFDVMVRGPSVSWLIEKGYLSDYDYYAPEIPNLEGVETVAGDFKRSQLGVVMNKPRLIGNVVEHYLKLAAGKPGIVFATNREHSRNLVAAFQEAGVRAAHVDGALPAKERHKIVDAFKRGELDVMSNCELFGEGLDVPGIVYVGLARPTKSLSLHLQQVGRALRVFPGKGKAIICDHAGNAVARQLGLPDDERQWTLEGRVKRKTGVNDDATTVTQCPACFRVYPSAASQCPGCSTDRPVAPREVRQEAGTLTKLEREELRRAAEVRRKIEERQCETFDEFISLGKARGYKRPEGWAALQCKLRHIPRVHGPKTPVGVTDEDMEYFG